jgi:hypothetical protein
MERSDKSNLVVVIGNFDSVRQRRRLEVARESYSRACDLFVGELRLASLYFREIAITPQHFIDGPLFLELGPLRLLELVGRQSSSLSRELPISIYSQAESYEAALRGFIDRPNPQNPGNLYPMEFAVIRRGTIDRREFASWLGQQPSNGRNWDDPVSVIHGLMVEFSESVGSLEAGKAEADRICTAWRLWIENQAAIGWRILRVAPKVGPEHIDEVEYTATWKNLSEQGRVCLEALRNQMPGIGRSQQRSLVRGALSGRTKALEDDGDVINDWYDSLLHRVFAQTVLTSYKEIVEKSFFEGSPSDARLERAGWKSKISDGFLPLRLQDGWLSTLAVMPVSKFEQLNFELRAAQSSWWTIGDELSRQRINLALNQAIALESLSRKRWGIFAKLIFAGVSIVISVVDAEANLKLTWLAAIVGILLLLPDIVDFIRILPWALGGLVTSSKRKSRWRNQLKRKTR